MPFEEDKMFDSPGEDLNDLFEEGIEDTNPEPEKAEESETKDKPKRQKLRSVSLARKTANIYRRAFSECQLLDTFGPDFRFEKGMSYHVITAGDVDALSFLRVILRQQDLEYCLFSTWCMALEDVYQIEDFLKTGRIKKVDAYVGEIFPGSYRVEYSALKNILEKYGGRVCVFKNHSKIFAGKGDKFAFGIETSANINTNPRTENGCITIGQDIFEFYKTYFDGIKSFI